MSNDQAAIMATQDASRPSRVAVLGTGKMGGILLQAFIKSGLFTASNAVGTVTRQGHARLLSEKLGVTITTDNLEAARSADVILLGVKPFQIADLVRSIQPVLTPDKLLISIAAATKTRAIEDAAGIEIPVVRAMPNTPAMLGAGMTALCSGRFTSADHLLTAELIFNTVGRTVIVEEKHIDAVTGLSGSGPAFIYIIIEALAEGGVNVGLPRDVATLLAAQTAYGAAKMVLEPGSHPALLKDQVTTPAGTTVAGILALEEGGLRVTLMKAVKRATERARELSGS